MSSVNIASHLSAMAARRPNDIAIYCATGGDPGDRDSYARMTYAELDQRSDDIAAGLLATGIRRGDRAALMVKPGLNLFSLTFALIKAGIVPVLIDPGIGLKNIKGCIARSKPTAFIGIPQAHAARLVLGWGRETLTHLVTVGTRWGWGGASLEEVIAAGRAKPVSMAETTADEIAAILFTSGSTGPPKGAICRHRNFAAQVVAIREMFGVQEGEINVPTFPLFALFDPALGMTSVIPDMDASRPAKVYPPNVIEAVNAFGATTMFGSPALLNTVSRWGEAHGSKMPTLRRIMAAGAPVPAPIMRRMLALISPYGELFPPYGATESLPVAMMSSNEILAETWAETEKGAGVCVGPPVPSIRLRVIAITDEAIADPALATDCAVGEVGEIAVCGDVVTTGYLNDEGADARSKMVSASGELWHRMGDLGYLDAKGRLWFCGRKGHRVVLEDATLFSVNLEEVFNTHPSVYRTALVGVTVAGVRAPLLCVELEPNTASREKKRIEQELLAMAAANPVTARVKRVLYHPGFPVDVRHNAKINRETLAVWAQARLS